MYIPLGSYGSNPIVVLNTKRTVDLPKVAVVTHFEKAFAKFINEISILKKYRNKGIGKKILEEQLEENYEKGIRTILRCLKRILLKSYMNN